MIFFASLQMAQHSIGATHIGRNTWPLQKTMAIWMLVKGVNTSLSVRDASQHDPPIANQR